MEKGISVYPGVSYAAATEYLHCAKKAGFTKLFTSLHIPESNYAETINDFLQLTAEASKLGFEVMADISPSAFKYINVSCQNVDQLLQAGITSLRLDYGFTEKEIVNWTKSGLKIVLNASTTTEEELRELLQLGVDFSKLEACHNYYPRPDTGLSCDFVLQKTKLFHRYSIAIAAFIPCLANPRGPIYAGLPTIENHRNLNPLQAAKQLAYTGMIDAILFGDPLVDSLLVDEVGSIDENCIDLLVNVRDNLSETERKILFSVHTSRNDAADRVIRSATSRNMVNTSIKGKNIEVRKPGSITIDNVEYLRYMGELQIVKKELPAEVRTNIVAEVVPEEIFIIDLIRPGMKFRFIPK